MPTALGAADRIPSAETIDGVNLLPYLKGEKTGRPRDTLVFREGDYQAIIANGWKLQRADGPVKYRLFHLDQDPTEQNDVSATRPDRLAELVALLDAHNKQQAEPLWPSAVDWPIWIDKSAADNPTLEDDFIWWPN